MYFLELNVHRLEQPLFREGEGTEGGRERERERERERAATTQNIEINK